MTIWCGTDFSDQSQQAVRTARALAATFAVPLRLLHVVDELGAELTWAESEDHIYDPLRRRMDALVAKSRTTVPNVDVTGEVVPGVVKEVLAARASGEDLLVVSTLGGLKPNRWLVGSVAGATARIARVPILVARHASSFEEWAAGRRSLRVAVAVDATPAGRAALDWKAELRRTGPCDLILVHIAPSASRRAPTWRRDKYARARAETECALRSHVGTLPAPGVVEWRVVEGTDGIGAALAHAVSGSDPLVVGTNQRRGLALAWHGSASREALAHATTNVALVPMSVAVASERRPAPGAPTRRNPRASAGGGRSQS